VRSVDGRITITAMGTSGSEFMGGAGVSVVPDSARVCQMVGAREDPQNFLIMHAMAPNVAGVIGSAVAAGMFLSRFVF
jgi:carboxybiotin decarboxylase